MSYIFLWLTIYIYISFLDRININRIMYFKKNYIWLYICISRKVVLPIPGYCSYLTDLTAFRKYMYVTTHQIYNLSIQQFLLTHRHTQIQSFLFHFFLGFLTPETSTSSIKEHQESRTPSFSVGSKKKKHYVEQNYHTYILIILQEL